MINRSEPGATPDVGFTELELYLLDTLIRDKAGADSIRNRWPHLFDQTRPARPTAVGDSTSA